MFQSLLGHSCRRQCCESLSCEILVVRHSCGTLTPVENSCGTLTPVENSCGTPLWDTLVGHPCGTLFVGRSSFLQNSRVKSSKTSVSRDFLQKLHVKSTQRAFRSRHPPKVQSCCRYVGLPGQERAVGGIGKKRECKTLFLPFILKRRNGGLHHSDCLVLFFAAAHARYQRYRASSIQTCTKLFKNCSHYKSYKDFSSQSFQRVSIPSASLHKALQHTSKCSEVPVGNHCV